MGKIVSPLFSFVFLLENFSKYEPRYEKTNVLVSDLVRHKPGYAVTEDDWRLEISELGSGGIVLSV